MIHFNWPWPNFTWYLRICTFISDTWNETRTDREKKTIQSNWKLIKDWHILLWLVLCSFWIPLIIWGECYFLFSPVILNDSFDSRKKKRNKSISTFRNMHVSLYIRFSLRMLLLFLWLLLIFSFVSLRFMFGSIVFGTIHCVSPSVLPANNFHSDSIDLDAFHFLFWRINMFVYWNDIHFIW